MNAKIDVTKGNLCPRCTAYVYDGEKFCTVCFFQFVTRDRNNYTANPACIKRTWHHHSVWCFECGGYA